VRLGRTVVGTVFVIHSRPGFFVAESFFALFAGSCTVAQFSMLESVFPEERALVYVYAELALWVR
jgi:hypothetical protein